MSFRGAGGTPGGIGPFFIGFLMMCWGFYLLLQSIIVTESFNWGTGLFHVSVFGGSTSITGGMILIPLIFGIGMIFYNSRNLIGWALVLGSVSALLVGVLAGLQFTLRSMSFFDLLTILILSMGGLGLFLGSLRSQ